MSLEALSEHVTASMDGVVIAIAPTDPTERHNYCMHGETHMWRKKGEAASPELAGEDPYADQIPIARAIPFWGAISAKGYCDVIYHKSKKLSKSEWGNDALKSGRLLAAVKQLRSTRSGPYRVLCDNESFLDCEEANQYYAKHNIKLLHIPPRSPDLNPIEMFWNFVRKHLRRKDLADLRAGRPALGKMGVKTRLKAFLKTKRAQKAAANTFKSLKKKCAEVIRKKGAAIRS